MCLVFELLASGLAANPIVPGYHAGSKEGRRHRQNGFILAIDVSAFLPLDEFTATVDATVDAIKALPPGRGGRGAGARGARPSLRSRPPPNRRAAGAQGLARADRPCRGTWRARSGSLFG